MEQHIGSQHIRSVTTIGGTSNVGIFTSQKVDGPIQLPVVNEARYDSADVQDSPRCESGTRIRIQDAICQWADGKSEETLFWLVGPAGTGKSTIARTVAHSFASKKRLVAGYFFKRGDQGRNDTNRFFPTLAIQLSEMIPSFKACLRKFLDGLDADAVEKKGLEIQFEKLLRLPLADMPPTDTAQLPGVIIIDALDECERPEQLYRLIGLLSKLRHITSVRLRILMTSRPARAVSDAFELLLDSKIVRSLELHRIFPEDTRTDIRVFLEKRFADIRTKRRVQQNPWPVAADLSRLVQLATSPEPLFIYAATLCRFVYDERRPKDPRKQLRLWLKQCGEGKSQLHQIYDPILSQVFLGNEEEETDLQLQFLGATVVLATPLSVSSLTTLLEMNIDDVTWWLAELHAVLDIPLEPHGPLRLLHKSFGDFLLDSDDPNRQYRVDAAETHVLLAERCIRRMESGLKQDICDVRKPGAALKDIDKETISRCIPTELQYACLHWVHHLECSGKPLEDYVCTFFYEHVLHWLEALSLLRRLADGAKAIRKLLHVVKISSMTPPEFVDFVTDASRTILSFGTIIEDAPLQTYGSLLFLSPTASKLRQKLWGQRLTRLARIEGVKSNWDAHLHTFQRHLSGVSAATFSPNGRVLASASFIGEISLWNEDTGTPIQRLWDHSGVYDLALSSDNQHLATVTKKGASIWNVDTGKRQTLSVDSRIIAVAFLSVSELVTSDLNGSVCRWDVKTGARLKTTDTIQQGVSIAAFSHDHQLLVSAAMDDSLHISSLETGEHRCIATPHHGRIKELGISPNNQLLASAYKYQSTIRLWNAADGTQKFVLGIRSGPILAIAFSPDGQVFASSTTDGSVVLWNVATGVQQNILKVHESSCLAFSADSHRLATGGPDRAVMLWDTRMLGSHNSFFEVRDRPQVKGLVFSPNSELAATVSNQSLIQIWDAATLLLQRTLSGKALLQRTLHSRARRHRTLPYDEYTSNVSFSPDSKLLALELLQSGSFEIWDVETGEHQGTHKAVPWSTKSEPTVYRLGVGENGEWIMEGSEKVLWLPPEYRPIQGLSPWVSRDSKIFIGYLRGILRLKID